MPSISGNGRFEIPNIPVGKYGLFLIGDEVLHKKERVVLVGVDGADLGDIVVERANSIVFHPIDRATGKPFFEAFKARYPNALIQFGHNSKAWTPSRTEIPILVKRNENRLEIKNVPFEIERMVIEFIVSRISGPARAYPMELGPIRLEKSGVTDLGDIPVDLGIF